MAERSLLKELGEALARGVKPSKVEQETFDAIHKFLNSSASDARKTKLTDALTAINDAHGDDATRLTILQSMRLMVTLFAKHPEKLFGSLSTATMRRIAIMLTVPVLQPAITALILGGSTALITRVVTRVPKMMTDIDKWKKMKGNDKPTKAQLLGKMIGELKGKPTPVELALTTGVVVAVFSFKRVSISNPVIRNGWRNIPQKLGFTRATARKLDSYMLNLGKSSDVNVIDRLVARLPDIQ